jgi:hypothetical protein
MAGRNPESIGFFITKSLSFLQMDFRNGVGPHWIEGELFSGKWKKWVCKIGKKGASEGQLQYAADSTMISFLLDRSLAGRSG